MLPNKSSNSGAIKGVEVGEASFFLPHPCLLDEEEYEAGPVFRDNELQALCLASLPPLVQLEARARPTCGCMYPPSRPWLFPAWLTLWSLFSGFWGEGT